MGDPFVKGDVYAAYISKPGMNSGTVVGAECTNVAGKTCYFRITHDLSVGGLTVKRGMIFKGQAVDGPNTWVVNLAKSVGSDLFLRADSHNYYGIDGKKSENKKK